MRVKVVVAAGRPLRALRVVQEGIRARQLPSLLVDRALLATPAAGQTTDLPSTAVQAAAAGRRIPGKMAAVHFMRQARAVAGASMRPAAA